MQKEIYPCLWFDGNGKEAAEFYCDAFDHSKITSDTPLVVTFELDGVKFMALNGGPQFKMNPSISFFVQPASLEKTGELWKKLSDGGAVLMPMDKYPWSERYGWCQDKFGVSWQVMVARPGDESQPINPMLMFVQQNAGRAQEAIEFYTSIFPGSTVEGIMKYAEGEGDSTDFVKHAQFYLNGYKMMAMDSGGPHHFNFSEAISMVISCETQEEIDHYWYKLTEGGREDQCGWLKDKFGVSWQVVPTVLSKLMNDSAKAQKTMNAFMKMKKFDIGELIAASES